MALRLELGMPPVYVLVKELTEEVRDLLFEWSSELCELRPLFREPGLTKEKKIVNVSFKATFFKAFIHGRKIFLK